jgi:hypothetical protein
MLRLVWQVHPGKLVHSELLALLVDQRLGLVLLHQGLGEEVSVLLEISQEITQFLLDLLPFVFVAGQGRGVVGGYSDISRHQSVIRTVCHLIYIFINSPPPCVDITYLYNIYMIFRILKLLIYVIKHY